MSRNTATQVTLPKSQRGGAEHILEGLESLYLRPFRKIIEKLKITEEVFPQILF